MNVISHLLILSYIISLVLWRNLEAKSVVAMDHILAANINKTSEFHQFLLLYLQFYLTLVARVLLHWFSYISEL